MADAAVGCGCDLCYAQLWKCVEDEENGKNAKRNVYRNKSICLIT